MPQFDIKAPDGKTYRINGPEGGTLDQAIDYAKKTYGGPAKAPTDPDQGEFSKGFQETMQGENPDSLASTMEMGADLLPIGGDTLNANAQQLRDYAAQNQVHRSVPTIKDVHNPFEGDIGKTVSDLGKYIAGAAGSTLASGIPSMIGAGAGAAVGAKVAGPEGAVIGSMAGTALPAYAQNTGDLRDELIQNGVPREKASKIAAVGGIPITALDVASEIPVLNKLFSHTVEDIVGMGVKEIAKGIGKSALSQAKNEGITEGIQEGTQVGIVSAAVHKDPFTFDNAFRILDASLQGAIGGGLLGGGAEVISKAPAMLGSGISTKGFKPSNPKNPPGPLEEQVSGNPNPPTDGGGTGAIPETIAHVSDEAVIEPSYISKDKLAEAKQAGINTESFTKLSPYQIEKVQDSLKTARNLFTTLPAYHFADVDENTKNYYKDRNTAIKQGMRLDNDFQPGDGEIVAGTPITDEGTSLTNPAAKVKTQNPRAVHKKIMKQSIGPKYSGNESSLEEQGFYSKFNELVKTIPQKEITKQQAREIVASWKNKGLVTQEELDSVDLEDVLDNMEERFPPSNLSDVHALDLKDIETIYGKGKDGDYLNSATLSGGNEKGYKITSLYLKPQYFQRRGIEDPKLRSHFVNNSIVWSRSSLYDIDGIPTRLFQEIQSKPHQEAEKRKGAVIDNALKAKFKSMDDTPYKELVSKIGGDLSDAAHAVSDKELWHKYVTDLWKQRPPSDLILKQAEELKNLHNKFKNTVLEHPMAKSEAFYNPGPVTEKDIEEQTVSEVDRGLAGVDQLARARDDYAEAKGIKAKREYNNLTNRMSYSPPIKQFRVKGQSKWTSLYHPDATKKDFLESRYGVEQPGEYTPIEEENRRRKNMLPDFPFKKSWSKLKLKKGIIDAVREGLTQIAIPKGKAVAKIQGHGSEKAAPFYERRLVNELKELQKSLKFEIVDTNLEFTDKNATGLDSHITNNPEFKEFQEVLEGINTHLTHLMEHGVRDDPEYQKEVKEQEKLHDESMSGEQLPDGSYFDQQEVAEIALENERANLSPLLKQYGYTTDDVTLLDINNAFDDIYTHLTESFDSQLDFPPATLRDPNTHEILFHVKNGEGHWDKNAEAKLTKSLAKYKEKVRDIIYKDFVNTVTQLEKDYQKTGGEALKWMMKDIGTDGTPYSALSLYPNQVKNLILSLEHFDELYDSMKYVFKERAKNTLNRETESNLLSLEENPLSYMLQKWLNEEIPHNATINWQALKSDFRSEIIDDTHLEGQMKRWLDGGKTGVEKYPVTLVKFTPYTINTVKDQGLPMMQQVTPEPQFLGNVYDDVIVPTQIQDLYTGIEMTPKGRAGKAGMIRELTRIIKEVTGGIADPALFDRILSGEDVIGGLQWDNFVAVSMGIGRGTTEMVETAYHECWHWLERMGFISSQRRQILDNNTRQLKKYWDADDYLSGKDWNDYSSRWDGREEIRANAFGKAVVAHLQRKALPKTLPNVFRDVFRQALNVMERFANAIRGLGFESYDDIVRMAAEGKLGVTEGQQTKNQNQHPMNVIHEATHVLQDARMQGIARGRREEENKRISFADQMTEATQLDNEKTRSVGKQMGKWAIKLKSVPHFGSSNRVAGLVWESMARCLDHGAELLKNYANQLAGYSAADQDIRFQVGGLADTLSELGSKGSINEEGYLTYTANRDSYAKFLTNKGWSTEAVNTKIAEMFGTETDKVLIIKSQDPKLEAKYKDIAQKYIQVQQAFTAVLNDFENIMRKNIHELYKEELKGTDFSAQDLRNLLPTIERSKSNMSEKEIIRLENLIETIESFDHMKTKDFMPRMRFGSYGFVVKDTAGETVAFYTVEKGDFNKLYNKFQYDEAMQEIREKFSDTNKFKIIGDRHVTDLSGSPHPFKMTYSAMKNHIDPRFLNIEMLSSLLYSQGMNMDELENPKANANGVKENLINEVFTDIMNRGFNRRFSETKKIPGYSKDYDRAVHAYITGASHFISRLSAQREFSTIQSQLTNLTDDVVKEKLEQFMKFNTSPQEEYQKLRTMNFLWAMGGNLSSALLQAVTLPTVTLGNLTKYNPNLLQNMKTIGKWIKIGFQLMTAAKKTVVLSEGTFIVDWGDELALQAMRNNGTITVAQKQLIQKVSHVLRGMLTEEYAGFKPYETKSLGGQVKEHISNMAKLLGWPISTMEQATRFATLLSAFETFEKNYGGAKDRAAKVLKNDYRFQAMLNNRPDNTFEELAALYTMDETHGIFGKVGRPDPLKGLGGALFFPFMTYPYHMLEGMVKQMGQGKDGWRALGVTLGAMFLLGGLVGLPGGELIEQLLNALYNKITGVEEDIDLLIREKLYKATGSETFGKFVTQGLGRSLLHMDIAKRIGFSIPGQNIALTLLGRNKDPSQLLGVSGSILGGIGSAWNEYNNDSGVVDVASAMLPVGASNGLKAYNYLQEGVMTKNSTGERNRLITPEDVSAGTVLGRVMGITSDQIATARDKAYAKQLANNKSKVGEARFRGRAVEAATDMLEAQGRGDSDTAKEAFDQYQKVMQEYVDWNIKYHLTPSNTFTKTVMEKARDRIYTKFVDYKKVNKDQRAALEETLKALGD